MLYTNTRPRIFPFQTLQISQKQRAERGRQQIPPARRLDLQLCVSSGIHTSKAIGSWQAVSTCETIVNDLEQERRMFDISLVIVRTVRPACRAVVPTAPAPPSLACPAATLTTDLPLLCVLLRDIALQTVNEWQDRGDRGDTWAGCGDVGPRGVSVGNRQPSCQQPTPL